MSTESTEAGPRLRHLLRTHWRPHALRDARRDLREGWRQRELWTMMGLQEVRQRYRRSTLGPFWITLSMGIMVFALGMLYGTIFRLEISDYLPYLTAGFVVWFLLATMTQEGCKCFIQAEGMIRQLNAPVSIYAFREIWTALIAFAHHIWIFVIVALWFGVAPTWHSLWALPALLVLLLHGLWIALSFGLLSARFRDVPLIVASLVQVLFFVTPVIWRPDMLPERALLLELNPFYHLLDILRAPMLGQPPDPLSWAVSLGLLVAGWGGTLLFYAAYRWRIAYWV